MSCKKPVVVLVVANPEPDDPFTLKDTDGPMVSRYANGVDGPSLANPLELQTGMPGVLREGTVRVPSLVLSFHRELAK